MKTTIITETVIKKLKLNKDLKMMIVSKKDHKCNSCIRLNELNIMFVEKGWVGEIFCMGTLFKISWKNGDHKESYEEKNELDKLEENIRLGTKEEMALINLQK